MPPERPLCPLPAADATDHTDREMIELLPAVDQHLRDISSAVGIAPLDVLSYLLAHVSRRVRLDRPDRHADAPGANAPRRPGQTLVLRRVPIGRPSRDRLHQLRRRTGVSPSTLVARRIVEVREDFSSGRLETGSGPVEDYQLLLDVIHEREEAGFL